MNTPTPPQPNDLRRRLRELLSVPERDRTDEQWDEIIELEIQLAPGNRIAGPAGGGGGGGGGNQGGQGAGGSNQPAQARKHRQRNSNRRPNKPKPPQV